ncbi:MULTISPECIES: DUF1990 domain-containing protein [unclassified Rhodococcus (in: high G+C Gram-positive bacteria)]|uniref:DUF1990 domain-containing protein n=1 Tax=unclassified Rhodococcus (in: high G+C Gram-positive bacteria) TaxID=192944 RepID=UPI000E2BD251|nr:MULTISPECIES: DUF1990 domain-containing protein [unclassified Rhodococcus (in: high G+C Gram-positive bacteria)]RDI21872.1 uncharacterized protein (UPF0548 family) [Rhodococcus sp. AG1013]
MARDSRVLTYREVGATAGELPAGYRHLRESTAIGRGEDAFLAASDALMGWDVHRRACLRVEAESPIAVPGTTVELRWFGFTIPCRVIYVVDEPDRRGFAYGTLTGHPESGEERFCVERHADGAVVATITAFSRPGRWFTRVGDPVARLVQRAMTRRYLDAFAD